MSKMNVTVRKLTPKPAAAVKTPRPTAEETAAMLVLFASMPAADRRLTLREAWRLVPRPQRSAPALLPARPYVPKNWKGLFSAATLQPAAKAAALPRRQAPRSRAARR